MCAVESAAESTCLREGGAAFAPVWAVISLSRASCFHKEACSAVQGQAFAEGSHCDLSR